MIGEGRLLFWVTVSEVARLLGAFWDMYSRKRTITKLCGNQNGPGQVHRNSLFLCITGVSVFNLLHVSD